jgi:tripartite-type tricarboxylate transporter receptor subunit TctC
MRRDFLKAASIAALAGMGIGGTTGAHSQGMQASAWPSKPVRLVLSHPAGSGVDSIARLISERLQAVWGQVVVIDNKPGGQNVIGAQAVQHAAPDGYTLYFSTIASLVTNTYMFKGLPYDPLRDFTPIAFVAISPFGVIVRTESPIKSIQDLIARAKAEPGKVSIANEGPKTFSGLTTRLFNARAKIDTNQISYVSVGTAVQDTIGGQTDALIADLATTAPLIRQGRLRLLATTAVDRVQGWDGVPALAELLPGFDMTGWFSFVAPVGTPKAVIDKANKDINMIVTDKDMVEKIHMIGPVVEGNGNPEQVAAFMRKEHARWAEISKEIGLLPE